MSTAPATTAFAGIGTDTHLIAGTWRAGSSESVLSDTNPYDDSVVAEIQLASADDVDEAYAAAEQAQPAWAATTPAHRQQVIARAADLLEEHREEIVDLLIRESGSTHGKANLEVNLATAITREAASFPARSHGRIMPSNTPGQENRVYRQAKGVIGVISPWNFPLHLSIRSVAPALALGNSVVVKPASDTPITGGVVLARIFELAGVPTGVISTLAGRGSEIGDYFVTHQTPAFISFTGSTPVGKRLGALAMDGGPLKEVALELGGNAPLVVLDDADVDAAVQAATTGSFLHQGEICMATNRVIVDQSIYDEFLEKFAAAVAEVKAGDPAEEDTMVGPIINDSQLDGLKTKIDTAKQEGARVLVEGSVEGRVVSPYVFADVTADMEIAREEIFGPLIGVLKADDEEHAVELANSVEFGLSAALYTGDLDRGDRVALRIESGMVHVNSITVDDEPHVMFGGVKNSGLGRFNGEWLIEEFTTDRWISVKRG